MFDPSFLICHVCFNMCMHNLYHRSLYQYATSFFFGNNNKLEHLSVMAAYVVLCIDYIKKYSRPIGFLYFYRPINIIMSAE